MKFQDFGVRFLGFSEGGIQGEVGHEEGFHKNNKEKDDFFNDVI
jgi:hypothetical protein